jgi:hypothetical protein
MVVRPARWPTAAAPWREIARPGSLATPFRHRPSASVPVRPRAWLLIAPTRARVTGRPGSIAADRIAKPAAVPPRFRWATLATGQRSDVQRRRGLGSNAIQSTTPGPWALNVKNQTNLRFLNVPQVIGYAPGIQAQTLPSLPDACSSNADCSGGDVCGTDNGARFGRASSADLCWASSCTAPPAGYCGSVLSPCGTCP